MCVCNNISKRKYYVWSNNYEVSYVGFPVSV